MTDVRAVVLTGAGGNFCSGGDVHEIIGPLVAARARDDTEALLRFTRMTGELVKAMRACPQPIIAAVDGVCVGAGAILAMASDFRFGTPRSRVAFLFVRVGLSGADMGACAILPRIIGQGRASELLYTGRAMDGAEAERIGFFNRLVEPDDVLAAARHLARSLADGPTVAHATTKRCLDLEWDMSLDAAIETEARRRRRAWRPRTSPAPIARSWPRRRSSSKGTDVADVTYLQWPFFAAAHRRLQSDLRAWRDEQLRLQDESDPSVACQDYVGQLGRAGWLRYAVPQAYGGALASLDVRTFCLIRETLGYASGLAEFAFAMQGLGSGPVSLFGSEALKQKYLPAVAAGSSVAAFAISEAGAGSDLTAMQTTARRDGASIVIDGEKTWISNAGIAAYYVVFCRWPEGGDRSFMAVVVDAGTPGLSVGPTIDVMAPHPLGTLTFTGCRVPADAIVGEPGKGLRVALGTLDVFRTTVGAAALGFARRALDEAVGHVKGRVAFGKPLGGVPADPGAHRRHGDGHRRGGAAGLSRRLDARPGRRARHARGGDGQAGRHRAGAAGDRSRGAAARRPRRRGRCSRSSGSIARFARCAFTRARARSRSWSSPGRCCNE